MIETILVWILVLGQPTYSGASGSQFNGFDIKSLSQNFKTIEACQGVATVIKNNFDKNDKQNMVCIQANIVKE